MWVEGCGLRVEGIGFGGLRLKGFRFRISSSGFRV